MKFRSFGNTGMQVSEVGFGAWAIGGGPMVGNTAIGYGPADDRESTAAIHAALDAGINFFDTADIYGLGKSEELLGKALAGEKNIIIATKVGNVARNGGFTTDYSSEHIIEGCHASLRRLNCERIDFYQLHTARMAQLEEGACITAMELLQKQGKIRSWGLSLNTFEPMPEAELLMKRSAGHGFQLVLNLLNQVAAPILKKAGEQGYGIIARMPLQFGLLTGKFDEKHAFAENDHRRNRLTPGLIHACNTSLEDIWKLCSKYQCSKTALALSFILGHPEVSVVIPGIRNPKQVQDNTSGLFRPDEGDMNMIRAHGKEKFLDVLELIRKQG